MEHDHGDHDIAMDMDMMATYFTFTKSGTVLFKPWNFSTIGGLVGSMVAIYAMAFTYEALKFYRTYLLTSAMSIRQRNKDSGDSRFTQLTILSKSHLIQTILHGIQMILSYFLMLIFMTYNVWLCLAVALGLVCGYFVFGWRTPVINSISEEHCS